MRTAGEPISIRPAGAFDVISVPAAATTPLTLPGIGLSIPHVVEREAEPYLALGASGAMRDLPQFAPPLLLRSVKSEYLMNQL